MLPLPRETDAPARVIDAPIEQWRCDSERCRFLRPDQRPPLFSTYTEAGGVYIKAGHLKAPMHYIVNINRCASVVAHCPRCHTWRELYRDPITRSVTQRASAGPDIAIVCACTSRLIIDD